MNPIRLSNEDLVAPDGCDIPLNAVRSAVISGGCDAGFVCRYDGGIERTGNAEDSDYEESEDEDEDEDDEDVVGVGELGRGLRSKNEPKRYGDWEKH